MPHPPIDLLPADQNGEELLHNAGNDATGGIWRVPRDGGTAVLKLALPPAGESSSMFASSTDPGHWNYWRRESLAYSSGLAATAYAGVGLSAPELLELRERPDGSVALWLDDVDGVPGMKAAPADFADLAERLGAAHARRLDDVPPQPWLARDWLRDYTLAWPVEPGADWDHPVVAAAWTPAMRETLHAMWDRRHDLLAATDALPRTLCHHDVWPMNVIFAPRGPVLLDWAFVGPGPIGEDVANLILDAFWDGMIDSVHLPEVASAVTEGYLRGLAGAVPADLVRHAIRVTGAAKYFWLAPRMVLAAGRTTTGRGYDQRGPAAMIAGRAPVLELLSEWAAQELG